MEVQSYDSRVINGVRIFRAVVWNNSTKTGKNLYAPSKEMLTAQINSLIRAEKTVSHACPADH